MAVVIPLKCNDGGGSSGERQVGTGNGLAEAAALGKTAVTGKYRVHKRSSRLS